MAGGGCRYRSLRRRAGSPRRHRFIPPSARIGGEAWNRDIRGERLQQFASDLGLDRGEFDECLDFHKHIGLIDDKLVVGYMSFEKFRLHIEEALAEQ